MDTRRENRVLRIAVVILLGVVLADVVRTSGQTQRLPGPGTGIVDVKVVDDARVVQQGEWRVAQQGEWRVGVTGTVATLPPMPPLIKVNGKYTVRWSAGAKDDARDVTVRELHPSGWARVGADEWVNLAAAIAIAER